MPNNVTIVATQSYLNQKGPTSSVTLYTPTAAADVLVTVYISASSLLSGTNSIFFTFSWTDEVGAQSRQIGFNGGGQLLQQPAFPCHLNASTNLSVVGSGTDTTTSYNAHITVLAV